METTGHHRTIYRSASWVTLIVVTTYLSVYTCYRALGPVEADYSFNQRTKRLITVTDPDTGKTSTILRTSTACGVGPPRMRADTGTGDERFLAALFRPALYAEEKCRRVLYAVGWW